MLKAVSIAGIEEQGIPFKKESVALDEAAKTISIGNLTWIECVVDDIVDETPKILEKLEIKRIDSEYKDGPPCIEVLAADGIPEGGRDNALFHYAVYAKKKWPSEWKNKIILFNEKAMNPPQMMHQ